ELQWEYLRLAKKYVQEYEDDDPVTTDVLERWEHVLDRLEDDPRSLERELDWVAKLSVLDAYRERDSLGWDHPKLDLIDLQYHDVRRTHGLYYRLADAGKMERLVSDAEVDRATMEPPDDTRAYFRGRCIQRYASAITAASWDSIIFDTGREVLQRVPLREPLRGTREHVEELLETSDDAVTLIERLQA
ncbi:MAG: proteasome accessory factor PafA2 family protein, partial [Actinomycetota bacterium]